jgi:UDP-2,3-diacylglucosamine hydrolase
LAVKNETIGLVAGGGKFPLMVAQAARSKGFRVAAVAHIDETMPSLAEKVDSIIWVKLGQLGKVIKALKKEGVKNALMAGTISKRKMFDGAKPDLKAISLMAKLAIYHDDSILRGVANEFALEGIEIISSTFFLPELSVQPGCLTKRRPNKLEKSDIEFGWKMAKELGVLDIGQCVVVREKTVLAVEAMEGTDNTILRGGTLAKEKSVVVKVSKPNQDLRFDMPSVGLETVKAMNKVKASVLAVEAYKTLIFDKIEMINFANDNGISIISSESGFVK